MLTVSTTAVAPAVAGDFTQTGTSLTIAAGMTTSTGLVTVLAVGNSAITGNKQVRVSATAAGGARRGQPGCQDADHPRRRVRAVGERGERAGDGGGRAGDVHGAAEHAAYGGGGGGGDEPGYGRGDGLAVDDDLLRGTWNTEQTVTVTGVDDNVDDGTVTWQVRLDTSSSGDSDYNSLNDVDVDVTTTDNDGPPTVTMALNPSSVAGDGRGGDGDGDAVARLRGGDGADGDGGLRVLHGGVGGGRGWS